MVISSKRSEPRAGARVAQGQGKEGQGGEKENGVVHGVSLLDEDYASPVPEFLAAIAGAKGASEAAAVCIVQPTLPKNCILHGGRLAGVSPQRALRPQRPEGKGFGSGSEPFLSFFLPSFLPSFRSVSVNAVLSVVKFRGKPVGHVVVSTHARRSPGCHCIPRSQMARQLHRMKLHPPRAQQW